MENPIGQVQFTELAFGGDIAFVETQYLVWGTNTGPTLRALRRTPRGWVEVAEKNTT